MLELIKPGYWKGEYIIIQDRGPISFKAKTRLYEVAAKTGQKLGHIKWMKFWRKYAFFTNNVILEEDCMADLSQFLRERTEHQKQKWKKISIVDWDKVEEYDSKSTEVMQV
jgi:hypothetical protein